MSHVLSRLSWGSRSSTPRVGAEENNCLIFFSFLLCPVFSPFLIFFVADTNTGIIRESVRYVFCFSVKRQNLRACHWTIIASKKKMGVSRESEWACRRSVDTLDGGDVGHLVIKGLVMNGPVVQPDLAGFRVQPGEGVLCPVGVVPIREILASVSTSALLARLGTVHREDSLGKQVLELQRFHKIGVPVLTRTLALRDQGQQGNRRTR